MKATTLVTVAFTAIAFLGVTHDVLAAEPVHAGTAEGAEVTNPAGAGTAQDEPDAAERTFSFGVEKGLVIPIGDWGDFGGVGLGVLGRVEYWLSPQLAVTVNPGLAFRLSFFPAFHGGGVENSTTDLLLTGGMKYMLTSKLGVHGHAGLNVRTIWADTSETKARGALIVGAGYKFARSWSIGANVFVPNLLPVEAGENVNTGVIVSVGHGFM